MPYFKLYTVFHQVPKSWDYVRDDVNVPFVVGPNGANGPFETDWGELHATYASERCQFEIWRRIEEGFGEVPKYLGFQSYRRRFRAPLPVPPFPFDVAIAQRMHFGEGWKMNEGFCSCHPAEAWKILEEGLMVLTGSLVGVDSNFLAPFCHWIIRLDHFNSFMQFWWQLCQYIEPRVAVPREGYQSRLFSFLSDRIFTIWLHRNPTLRVIDLPYDFLPHGLSSRNDCTAV